MRALVTSLLLTALFAGAGCLFDFERGVELSPGDVAGRVLRPDGTPAAFARLIPEGRATYATATSDGAFRLSGYPAGTWVLRVEVDDNGDGRPELAAVRTFAVNVLAHADGLFGTSAPRLSYVLLGDVQLQPVVSLRGGVQNEFGTAMEGAIVVAFRRHELPPAELGDGLTLAALEADGEIEAITASDELGRFRFRALAAGEISLVAFGADGASQASTQVRVAAPPGSALDEDDLSPLVLVSGATARDVQLEVAGDSGDDRLKVVLVPAGEPLPADAFASFDDGDVFPAGQRSLPVRAGLGLWDAWVQSEGGDVVVLRRRVADLEGDPVVVWATGALAAADSDEAEAALACAGLVEGDAERDCDADGVNALPFLSLDGIIGDPDRAAWQACIAACTAGDAACEVSGDARDCDDDGDGQPDVTEPFECTTLSAGQDRDGDLLCELADPFPQCIENRAPADACSTDADPPAGWPGVPPVYEGRVCTNAGAGERVSFVNDGSGTAIVQYFEDRTCRVRDFTTLMAGQGAYADASFGSMWRMVTPTGGVLIEATIVEDGDRVFFANGESNDGPCTTIQGPVTNFSVHNAGNSSVWLFWADHRCAETQWAEITPGQTRPQDAPYGYMWRVYASPDPQGEDPLLELVLTEGQSLAFTVAGPDAGPVADAGPDGGALDGGDGDGGVTDGGDMDGGPGDVVRQVSVPVTANIYGAGHAAPPAASQPGTVPPSLDVAGFSQLSFTSTGTVFFGNGTPNNPDGEVVAQTGLAPDVGGLAGPASLGLRRMLLAVFLPDEEPADPPPAQLNQTTLAFDAITPRLGQIFTVGDGLTGTGTGTAQTIVVPDGATRLFFGFYDSNGWGNLPGNYGDNSGTLQITASLGTAPVGPSPDAFVADAQVLADATFAATTTLGDRIFVSGQSYAANAVGRAGARCAVAADVIFVAELDSSGACLWAREIGFDDTGSYAYDMDLRDDSLVVTGFFLGSLTARGAAGVTPNSATATTGESGVFVARYATNGAFRSLNHALSSEYAVDAVDVVALEDERSAVLLYHYDDVTLDPLGAGVTVTGANDEATLAVFDDSGLTSSLWIETTSGGSYPMGLASADLGASGRSLLVAVQYYGDLLPGTAAALPSTGGDTALVRLDPTMGGWAPVWGTRMSSSDFITSRRIRAHDDGDLLVMGGGFRGSFAAYEPTSTDGGVVDAGPASFTMTASDTRDGFLAVFDRASGAPLSVTQVLPYDLREVAMIDGATAVVALPAQTSQAPQLPPGASAPAPPAGAENNTLYYATLDLTAPALPVTTRVRTASGTNQTQSESLAALADGSFVAVLINGGWAFFEGAGIYDPGQNFRYVYRGTPTDTDPPVPASVDAGP